MSRRLVPAVALVLLAPWVAEYLLGSFSVPDLPLLVYLAPMYGGGALVIREVARRTGRGWPTILLLGLAYGFVEAGLLDQSLFNPDYMGLDFQSVAPVPGLGVSAYFALSFTVGHAIWSIGVPIAIVEALFSDRGTTPWLGVSGLVAAAGLYVFGGAIIFADLQATEQFRASPLQIGVAAAIALVLVAAAFLRAGRTFGAGRRPPRPLLVGAASLVGTGLLKDLHPSWIGVVFGLGLLALGAWAVTLWSADAGWSPRHRLALAGGALLSHAWGGFWLAPWNPVPASLGLLSDLAFALAALALIAVAAGRVATPAVASRP